MYTCCDCGETFEDPKQYVETHGLDGPPYEKYYGCPYCGGSYVDAMRCDGCGDYISGTYVVIGDERFCECCFEIHEL